MPSLLDLSFDMQRIEEMFEESQGEVTPDITAALDSWALDLEGQFESKADQYAALIREKELRAEVRLAEADRLKKLAVADEDGAGFLRDRLKAVMEDRNIPKLKTARYTISIGKNGGKVPLKIDEQADIPGKFFTVPAPVLDREQVRTALESGEKLAFAELGDRGTRLNIR